MARFVVAAIRAAALLALALSPASASFTKPPYLQNLAGPTVVVRWETSTAQPGKVEYGLTGDYGMMAAHLNPATDHELTLTWLDDDTIYHYRAISGADTSPDATFRSNVTGHRPFRFFAYGDNRSDSAAHQSVVDRMMQQSPLPSLAVNVGDLTYDGSTPVYQTFFNVERHLLSRLPLYPGLGNHDDENMANWTRFFALPGNERWYTARYGNSVFHCLDNYSTYTPGSEQYNWFLSELQADSADPSIRHVFVFFHEPPYTTNAGHSSNLEVRQYLCPLFERFHVQLTFQGHVHCYEHSLVNGVHYVITGGGGAPLSTGWGSAQPWTIYREATFEFTLVDVRGDSVLCRSIKPDGTVFDSFAIVTPQSGLHSGPPAAAPDMALLRVSSTPFSRRVRLTVTLQFSGAVNLTIFDADGRCRATLHDGLLPAGEHSFYWEPVDAPVGSYIARLRTARGGNSARFTYSR